MILKKAFRSGHALVIALPKKYAEALRIVPGTPLVVTLQNRAIHISRGVITPESMLAKDVAAATPVGTLSEED